MNSKAKIATGFLTGALLGAAVGLLFAPTKGSKIRSLLAEKVKGAADATSHALVKTKNMLGLNKRPLEQEVV